MTFMDWTMRGLKDHGFIGFVPFAALPSVDIGHLSNVDGVYRVLRTANADPVFLARSVGGHYQDKDPTVSDISALRKRWVPTAHVLYIGKAAASSRGDEDSGRG